jgi:hypothetical protein
MAKATYEVLVDWDDNDSFADSNEDITEYVRSVRISHGRDYASQLIGQARSAMCTVELTNPDGRFSSFNSSGPLYGNLVAGRKIRVTMDVAGSKTTIWQGFVDSIIPRPRPGGYYYATLRAVGPLAIISQQKVTVAMQTSITPDTAIGAILDEIGWPAGDRDLDTGQTTMNRWWTGNRVSALHACRQIETTDFGFIRETRDGKLAYEDRHHRLKAPHTSSQATFTDAAGGALQYGEANQSDPLKQVFNRVSVSVQLYSVGGLATLWAMPSDEVPLIGPGDTEIFWASYPNPDSSPEAEAVDAWTTPAATTDYTANTASDDSGTDLTSSIGVAVSKFDTAMKISLTNNAAQPAYITKLQARGTPVNALDPIKIESEDSASQSAYGDRLFPSSAKFIPATAEAKDFCNYVLSIYAEPIPVISIAFVANRDNNHLDQARLRDVGDRITLVANNNTDLGINEDFFVERVDHRIDAEGLWHFCTLHLSPASFFGGFWVLGSSALGTDTKLAY